MARMKLAPLVLTALLIITAGCGGITSAPGTSTTTDAPTSTNNSNSGSNTGNSSELAPGLTESGVTDAWALAQAHRNNLANVTYTERAYRSVHANGTLLRNVSTILKRGHGERYIYEFRTYGMEDVPLPNLTVFRNDSTLVQRTLYDNGTVAYTGPENAATPQTEQYGSVYSVLTASNTTVVDTVKRNGKTLYRLTSVSSPSESSAYVGVDNYEMSALVGPNGLVHEYHISYETTRDGRMMNVTVDRRFVDRGETQVHPPEWVAEVEQ